jgi:hypothetical protein
MTGLGTWFLMLASPEPRQERRMEGQLQQSMVHVGYGLMLVALLARDILWLRGILVLAQGCLAYYAWYRGVMPIAFWNLAFVAINAFWVTRILRERAAVELPPELKALYDRHFAALTPPEFLRFWSWAERRVECDSLLATQGQRPQALYFLLRGQAEVRQGGRELARLGAGSFVAEMSLLTGETASADVRTLGEVELMRWPAEILQQTRARNPALWTRIQSALGHDLVEKIRRAAAPSPNSPA